MSRRRARVWLLAVLALTAGLYAPSLQNTFAWDDRFVVLAVRDSGEVNEMVHDLQPLGRYFTTAYWHGVEDRDILYRPVTILSYALTYAWVGRHLEGEAGEALPHHVLNVALHLLAVWLTYLVVRRLGVGRGGALVGALVFGVHAIHSEVVAGIVGRAELLALCAGAGALLCWERGRRRLRPVPLALAAVLLLTAFCSKESAVAWAAFLPTFAVARELRADPSASLPRLLAAQVVPALLVCGVPFAVFLVLRGQMIAGLPEGALEGWSATQEAKKVAGLGWAHGMVQWAYALLITVVPFHLSADHGPRVFDTVDGLADPRLLAAAAALGGLLAGGLLALRRRPALFLAMASFFGFSALTANVLFPIGTDYAERLYYAPSLGASFAAAWAVERFGRRPVGRVLAVVLALWVAWSAGMVLSRNGVWRDDAALFGHEVVNQPRSATMQAYWAGVLAQRGQDEEALRHMQLAIPLFPDDVRGFHWNRIGVYHAKRRRFEEARRCFEAGLASDGTPPRVRVRLAVNLAGALAGLGRHDLAEAPLRLALQADAAHLARQLGTLAPHFAKGTGGAWFEDLLARGEQQAPSSPQWALHRGELAYGQHRYAAAREHLQRFLAAAPDHARAPGAMLMLASSLTFTGELDRALDLARQVARHPQASAREQREARTLATRIEEAR